MDHKAWRRLAADVDEQHRESMRTITDDLGELHFGTSDPVAVANRRQFLKRVSVGGAALAVGGATIGAATLIPQAAAQSSGGTEEVPDSDLAIVVYAESVELAVVSLYQTAMDTKKFTTTVTEVARNFSQHHTDHATALGTLAGKKATNTPNAALTAQFSNQIKNAANADAIIQVLYQIEEAAAATYESALGTLETISVAGAAATILPVEGQHAVVWGQALKLPTDQWLPAFQTTSGALDPGQYPTS